LSKTQILLTHLSTDMGMNREMVVEIWQSI